MMMKKYSALVAVLVITVVTVAYAWNPLSGGGGTAGTTTYDNTTSGLTATDVKSAIDELYSNIAASATTAGISDEVYDATSWNGVITLAPSKNAVRDKIEGLSLVYQPLDSDLTTWATVTPSANGQSLVSAADYAAMRGLLDLEAGTDFNAYDADLAALAAISGVRGDIIYYGASGWTRLAKGTENYVLTMGANDPAWAEATGGGGSSTLDGLTDVTITTAAAGDVLYYNGSAWVNLARGTTGQYLKTGTTPSWDTPSGAGDMLAASYPHIVAIEALTHTDGNIIVGDGSTWVAESGTTARTSLGLAIGTNVQAWDAQLDDIADGTLAGDFVNTAYPWADNEVANDLTISGGTINNSIIGGSVAAAGTFTTLSAGATGFSVDADGDVICKSLSISQSTASAGGWMGYEDGDNGTNTFTWLVPAAITANRTFQMTDTDPTGTQVMAGTLSDSTITLSWVTPLTSASIDTSAELASILGDEIGTGYVLFSGALGSPGSIPAYFTVLHTSSGAEFKGQVYAQEIDDGNSSTSDTIDWTTGNNHKSTMTGNCTYTFTAPSGPAHLTLRCIADGTLRTITWPSSVKWGSAGAPAMTSTNGYWDVICLYYDGTNYSATYSQGYN